MIFSWQVKRLKTYLYSPLIGWGLYLLFSSPLKGLASELVADGFDLTFDKNLVEELNPYQAVRQASFVGFDAASHDLYIKTRLGATHQLFALKMPLGQRYQKTFYDEPLGAIALSPDPANPYILLLRDQGGNEDHQIYLFDKNSGKTIALTSGNAKHGGLLWFHSGEKFLFTSNERNGKDRDIYIYDLKTHKSHLVIEATGSFQPEALRSDDQKLVVSQYISSTDQKAFLYDLVSHKLEPLLAQTEQVAFGSFVFGVDQKHLFLTWDYRQEFQTLVKYDLTQHKIVKSYDQFNGDMVVSDLDRQGHSLAVTSNQDGITKVHILDVGHDRFTTVSPLPMGVISDVLFQPSDPRVIGFSVSSADSPGDVFTHNLETKVTTRWSESEVGGLDPKIFINPQLIRYPTFDQTKDGQPRQIPAFVYKPHSPAKDEKFPVLIYIHGGPESQYRPTFSTTTQFVLNHFRMAVIAPNVRGSRGYGKSYLKLDNGYLREDSVKDIGALLDWIDQQGDLDNQKVLVSGGSYGGYMALASLAHYSDRLAGGIDRVGISNFVTFLLNTRGYRRDLRRVEYGDEQDPKMRAFLESISPANQADRIKKPLFIVQGLNDPRVPHSESQQMVAKIRKAGQSEVWYLLAKDEGHGFRKKSNQDVYLDSLVKFIGYVLKGHKI